MYRTQHKHKEKTTNTKSNIIKNTPPIRKVQARRNDQPLSATSSPQIKRNSDSVIAKKSARKM